jgi:hypothetical protein
VAAVVDVQDEWATSLVHLGESADLSLVARKELNRWFFALFDLDDNGAIDRDEWRLAEHYRNVPLL